MAKLMERKSIVTIETSVWFGADLNVRVVLFKDKTTGYYGTIEESAEGTYNGHYDMDFTAAYQDFTNRAVQLRETYGPKLLY